MYCLSGASSVTVHEGSQTSNRATTFVNGFKRLGRTPAIVDHVAAGSRFKYVTHQRMFSFGILIVYRLFLPKDNQVLTLVLGGE